jgi:hypothetical protein
VGDLARSVAMGTIRRAISEGDQPADDSQKKQRVGDDQPADESEQSEFAGEFDSETEITDQSFGSSECSTATVKDCCVECWAQRHGRTASLPVDEDEPDPLWLQGPRGPLNFLLKVDGRLLFDVESEGFTCSRSLRILEGAFHLRLLWILDQAVALRIAVDDERWANAAVDADGDLTGSDTTEHAA